MTESADPRFDFIQAENLFFQRTKVNVTFAFFLLFQTGN